MSTTPIVRQMKEGASTKNNKTLIKEMNSSNQSSSDAESDSDSSESSGSNNIYMQFSSSDEADECKANDQLFAND